MTPFKTIRARAARRKGGEAALAAHWLDAAFYLRWREITEDAG